VLDEDRFPSRGCADILLIDPYSGERWLFEAALMAANTQPKWLDKIRYDAIKLRRVTNPGVRKFILLYCVSVVEQVCGDGPDRVWDGWCNKITADCTHLPEIVSPLPLGEKGQFALRLWEVTIHG
jgi:hypothetical protein